MDSNCEEQELIKLVQRQLSMKEALETKQLVMSPSASESIKGRSLFFKVLTDKVVRHRAISEVFQKAWARDGKVQIKLAADGIWMAIFDLHSDMERVLEQGPWHFNQDLVLVAAGSDDTKPSEIEFSTFKLWVHFLDLPLDLCSEECLQMMAEKLGKVIKIECLSSKEVFSNRALIELSVGLPFCKQVKISLPNGKEITVPLSYEKLPRFCLYCGCPGHIQKVCSIVRNLRRQIERISDDKKRFELLEHLKPKYDSTLCFKRLNGSSENKSNSSEGFGFSPFNTARSSPESLFSSPIIPLIHRKTRKVEPSGISDEEVTSPIVQNIENVDSHQTDNIQQLADFTEQSLLNSVAEKNVASICKIPIALVEEMKVKLESGSTSVRKWKKLIRDNSKNSSVEVIENSDEIVQIKGLDGKTPQMKRKRKKMCSPKSPGPVQKLKKAVGSSPLPNNQ